ncbi:MAG: hypothetical protein AAFY73_04330 [Pseudomonadota bacterium]
MNRNAVIVMGDSHYAALAEAAEARALPLALGPTSQADILIFNAWKHSLNYEFLVAHRGELVFNHRLKAKIDTLKSDYDAVTFACMFGGNHNHTLTLLQHPQPFDVHMPDIVKAPTASGAHVLTRAYVEATLLEYMSLSLVTTAKVAEAFRQDQTLHLSPPPCIGDDTFSKKHMGAFFEMRAPAFGDVSLTPRLIRQKIWNLQLALQKTNATRHGYRHLSPPPTSMDVEGFLASQFYGSDATHANRAYGDLLLRQLEDEIGAPIGAINYFD